MAWWLTGLASALYVLAAMALAAYGLHSLWLLLRFLRHRRPESLARCDQDEPFVLVQLPVYNERDVIDRLVTAAGGLAWPADRLRIQLLDDSDDDTAHLGAAAIARLRAAGVQAEQVRRADRGGFKAGALDYGLRLDAQHPDGPAAFVAIFDADFVPPTDFLRRALPDLLDDPRCAFVQGRWEHLNPGQNLLTKAQAVGIDGHFGIEQGARAWSGLPLNFNGTCGIWRRAAISDAGGWQHDTLTEDLDLSYRAHLAGWHASYRSDLAVPGELPADIDAWRSQQFRWAKGSIQTARKLLPSVWRSPWSIVRKLSATFHLTHYLVHPLILTTLVTAPVALPALLRLDLAAMAIGLALLCCGMLPPILLYAVSQRTLRRPWRRLAALPMLTAIGTGIAAANTVAVWQALVGHISPFVRTPKHGCGTGSYRAGGGLGLTEFLIASWGLVGLGVAWTSSSAWITPILALYVLGFAQQGVMLLIRRVREATTGAPAPTVDPIVLIAGALAILATLGMALPDTSWREEPLWFTSMALVLGLACLTAFFRFRLVSQRAGTVIGILVVGAILQVLAMGIWHSDDVHRYAIEGRQIVAGQNPYLVPPQAEEARQLLSPADFERVNHPHMTAIYPPLALLAHAGLQAIMPGITIFTVAAPWLSLVLIWATFGLMLRTGMRPALIVLTAWNPILVIFGSGEAHNDLLMALLIVLALGWMARRPLTGLATLCAAALCKPFAALLLPLALRQVSWRAWWLVLLLVLFAYLPFLSAGWGLFASLMTFGGSMHFHGALDPWLRLVATPLIDDEGLREAMIRVALVAMLAVGLIWLWLRRSGAEPARLAVRALAILMLCLPTLHPWYLLPVVALLPLARSWALPAWTCTAGVYWLHGLAMLETGTWTETHWVTALAHTPALAVMVWEAFGPYREALERGSTVGVFGLGRDLRGSEVAHG